MHLVAVGGSDAGISAALRVRELDPTARVTVLVADEYPNFSICGIPYYVSGDVGHWRDLAHRSLEELEATGMRVLTSSRATKIDVDSQKLHYIDAVGGAGELSYDQLVIATGARSVSPPIEGLAGDGALGSRDGVHLLHSMGDTFDLIRSLDRLEPKSAAIVGAGYIGLEMAEALSARKITITQFEQLQEVLPTVDAELGSLVHSELALHGVSVHTSTTVKRVRYAPAGSPSRLEILAENPSGEQEELFFDIVLVVTGVRPDTTLAESADVKLGAHGAIEVDRRMRTNIEHILAAGDCVTTHHRLLGTTYLPLGTTAHKQGRIAGENALGGSREFSGSLGTQVVKVFDMAVARTGLRDHEARDAGFDPISVTTQADDHKAYYPDSHKIALRITGDRTTGRLLGAQLFGHHDAEIAKRIDIIATAIFHEMTVEEINDLDLSYTPPLGSPWDAVQIAAQEWTRGTG